MYLINFYVSYANSDEITRELKMEDEVWKELRENVTALKKHKNILFRLSWYREVIIYKHHNNGVNGKI